MDHRCIEPPAILGLRTRAEYPFLIRIIITFAVLLRRA